MAESPNFGEFIIESLLGEGGMGRVYRARQVALDRWVALKVLHQVKENISFIERFYREAKAAAGLVHPNIIQIYTVGEEQGIPYFTMEYVEGEDIDHLLHQEGVEPFSIDEVLEVVRSVTKALAVAAEHSMVHRDIKPSNIMVTKSGLVKVMDFGLAKGLTTDQSLTQHGLIMGTPAYMSPEQGTSGALDSRSDQYSLGCVMYECLCGRPPFKADNVAAMIYKHSYEAAPPMSGFRQDVSSAVEALCLKMMGKSPDDRFQTPQLLLAALAALPSNPALAELALAKRVTNLLLQKKQRSGINKVALAPADSGAVRQLPKTDLLPPPEAPASSTVKPAGVAQAFQPVAAAPAARLVPVQPEKPASAKTAQDLSRILEGALALKPAAAKPRAGAPGSETEPPGKAELQNDSLAMLRPQLREARTSSRPTAALLKILDNFQKTPDGRWTYKSATGRCKFAEGLAAEVPFLSSEKAEGLGDCLLCSNWNKRVGCALAYAQELECLQSLRGLRLCTEQAIAWSGAGRYDKAVAILDGYLKSCPEDPEGYRELARLYDRPEYREKDKRRAIVLYARFVELAQRKRGFSNLDINRAEERISALKQAAPDPRPSTARADLGILFQAFYRGVTLCFSYGAMTKERIVVAKAGEIDPESGIVAAEMGGAVHKATRIIRRLLSEKDKQVETAAVKKELARLSDLPVEALLKDRACIFSLTYEQITEVSLNVDDAVGIRCLSVKTQPQLHQLLFTSAGAFRAEQCLAMIHRKMNGKV